MTQKKVQNVSYCYDIRNSIYWINVYDSIMEFCK